MSISETQTAPTSTRSYERAGVGRTLWAVFCFMALLIIGTIVINYFTSVMVFRAARRAGETHVVIDDLNQCVSILKNAETGQRGYLLTGDAKYLIPYEEAVLAIKDNFLALEGQVARGRLKPDDLTKLQELTQTKLDELAQTVLLKHESQEEAALAIVRTDDGLNAMNAIRRQVDAMIAALNADVDAQQRAASRADQLRMAVIVITAGVNLAFIGWGCLRLKREITAADAWAREVHRQKNLLAVTLSSMGRDSSDHKESEQRLRQAKAEVEAASRAKDHFLANLSHELRTPLTPVLATLDSWDAGGVIPPALATDVQIIRRNIGLEARLIDDLLDLTRIVRGKLPLDFDVVNVHELIEAVAAMCCGDARSKKIELSLQLEAKRHHARADAARLQQVFWNVLKNAVKFTPEFGHIEVTSTDMAEAGMQITFTDDGIGMSEQAISRVFRPFEQATEETARQHGGLGLGLAISRGLIEAQGGSISAVSPGPGKGSTISVMLPNVDAPTAPASAPRPATAVAATRNLSILLVEDHADTAHVMSRLLRRLGHTVQTSGTVAEAAELARTAPYDLLLSDIGLPDGTGIDLIRQIRAHRELTAIALTGYGMDDDIARCLEAGFTAHLTKPIDFQDLERMVQQVAEGSGNEKDAGCV